MQLLPLFLSAQLMAAQPTALIQREFPEARIHHAQAISSGYLVTGEYTRKEERDHNITNYHTPFITLLDAQMNPVWTTKFQESVLGGIRSVSMMDGRVYAYGRRYEGKEAVAWLVKVDMEGRILQDYSYYKEGFHSTEGTTVLPQPDGTLLLLGDVFLNYGSSGQPWVINVDQNGNKRWERHLAPSAPYAYLTDVTPTPDHGWVFTGTLYPTLDALRNQKGVAWLVKLDAQGKVAWEKKMAGTTGRMAAHVVNDEDGNLIVHFNTDGEMHRNDSLVVMDAKGNRIRSLAPLTQMGYIPMDMHLSKTDGTLWLLADYDKQVHLVEMDLRGQVRSQKPLGRLPATAAEFSPSGEFVCHQRSTVLAMGM